MDGWMDGWMELNACDLGSIRSTPRSNQSIDSSSHHLTFISMVESIVKVPHSRLRKREDAHSSPCHTCPSHIHALRLNEKHSTDPNIRSTECSTQPHKCAHIHRPSLSG
jgi:hypothetical protein